MKLLANQFGLLQGYRRATPVVLWSQRFVLEGRRSTPVPSRSCFSLTACAGSFLSGAQAAVAGQLRLALVGAPFRFASALAQRLAASAVLPIARAASRHSRRLSAARVLRFAPQCHAKNPAPSSSQWANTAVKALPSVAGTLRDKAPRSAPYLRR